MFYRNHVQSFNGTQYFVFCIVLVTSFLCFSRGAHSFENYEHKRLGDLAFDISMRMNDVSCETEGFLVRQDIKHICELLVGVGKNETYGDISSLVDYMLTPNILFSQSSAVRSQIENGLSYPSKHEELNQQFLAREFNSKVRRFSDLVRSLHNNEAHFQGQLHFELFDWHQRAIDLVRANRPIFSALVANAISDHYLHDYFAPGHISTARTNSHDLIATGMHDISNYLGAMFRIHNWNKLEDIANYIISLGALSPLSEELQEELVVLLENHSILFLHGDAMLHKNPRQEVFILLVEIFSINQVFKCYFDQVCEFAELIDYTWRTATVSREKPFRFKPPKSKIYFGEYILQPEIWKKFHSVLGLGIGMKSASKEAVSHSVNLEFLPFGFPGSPDFLRYENNDQAVLSTNHAPIVGVYFSIDDPENNYGLSFRYVLANPKINSTFSPYFRVGKSIRGDSNSIDDCEFGLRTDIGFSLLQLYLSVGKGFECNQSLGKSATTIGFGLNFSSPISRIPGLRRLSGKFATRKGFRLPNN